MRHYPRAFEAVLSERLKEPARFIQTVLGPRQVGKTSGTLNALAKSFKPDQYSYFSCEEEIHQSDWFLQQIQHTLSEKKKVLIFDEIQKVNKWSELVKFSWDKIKREKKALHIVLLGSSSLQLTQGLGESLTGRFEIIPAHHWSYGESKDAFDLTFDEFLTKGGYPGSYELRTDPARFRKYMLDSIFETVVTRDILRYATVRKPALFRQTFILACQYPAQEVSYNKLLGQLHEIGNVDQLKHYLELFSQAFLIRLIFKYSKSRSGRTSSPKILPAAPVFTALFFQRDLTLEEKGRVFEAMVGNRLCEHFESVHFWREGNYEIDFVVDSGKALVGVEVKSTKRKSSGTQAFREAHRGSKICFVDFENYNEFEKDPIRFLTDYSI